MGGQTLRAGKVQLTDSYILMKNGEAFLLGANITPLTRLNYFVSDPTRTRNSFYKELARLMQVSPRKGKPACAPRSGRASRQGAHRLAEAKQHDDESERIVTGNGKSSIVRDNEQ